MDKLLVDRLRRAARALADLTGQPRHDAVVVLGSGLGNYAEGLEGSVAIPYDQIPGFPVPGAMGHAGTAYSVPVGSGRALIYSGRVHAYEGFDLDAVTFAVRTAIVAGCRTVTLTNAAGGCGAGIGPGDLVCITDHLNLVGASPLRGPNDDRLGPRFPDMTDTYTPELREMAHAAADATGVGLGEGVYAWFSGPMFETPAEIRMAQILGADLVGMSTVPEAIAARHLGAEVLAISLCANLAAGLSGNRLSAAEVMEEGRAAADRFGRLLDAVLPKLVERALVKPSSGT